MKRKSFVNFMYETMPGRIILQVLLHTKILKLGEWFVHTDLSRVMIKPFIRNNHIDMRAYKGQRYRSFQEFFSRTRKDVKVDKNPKHLISPCDGYLSAYPIQEDSRFYIKGSWYKISDLVNDKKEARSFIGGDCVVVRLCADDYHHYCYIDDGFQREDHYIEGLLHSVQPIACESVPVYRLNRRNWNILETVNFGKVAQIEIGAVLVGGIVNKGQNVAMIRGKDMGHFELIGSTVVLLFQKNTIDLLPKLKIQLAGDHEVRVKQGQHIANHM